MSIKRIRPRSTPRPPDHATTRGAVGYGKPPRHTRFQKGKSGNPKGRPPKHECLSSLRDLGEGRPSG